MNKRLRIYYNLHKKCLSVLHKTKKGWRLKEHRKFIYLQDVRFIVYESGRQRVLKQSRKNVHAYVEGKEIRPNLASLYHTKIRYNPYLRGDFFLSESFSPEIPIYTAKYCLINGRCIYV